MLAGDVKQDIGTPHLALVLGLDEEAGRGGIVSRRGGVQRRHRPHLIREGVGRLDREHDTPADAHAGCSSTFSATLSSRITHRGARPPVAFQRLWPYSSK